MTQQLTPTHLQAHFYFLQRTMPSQKKIKKSLQANAPESADICASLTRHGIGRTEARTDNSTYKKLAAQCSADTFVVNQTLVLRIKFCGENRQLLVAAKRYKQA